MWLMNLVYFRNVIKSNGLHCYAKYGKYFKEEKFHDFLQFFITVYVKSFAVE